MAGGNGEDGGRLFGRGLGPTLLLGGAALAAILSFWQTARGMSIAFGGSNFIQGAPFGFTAALIVQGGLLAVSVYVARRFVQSRLQGPGGRGSGVGKSLTWLTVLILAILFPLSLIFSYSGFQEKFTSPQEPQNRVAAATRTAGVVRQIIDDHANAERRKLTKEIAAQPSFASWNAGLGQLIDAAVKSETVEKARTFERRAREERENNQAAAILEQRKRQQFHADRAKRQQDLTNLDLAKRERAIECEVRGLDCRAECIETSGIAGDGRRTAENRRLLEADKKRGDDLVKDIQRLNKQILDIEEKLEGWNITPEPLSEIRLQPVSNCVPTAPTPGAQRPPGTQAAVPGQAGAPPAPSPAQAQPGGPDATKARRQAASTRLVRNPDAMSLAVNEVKNHRASLADIYSLETYNKAVAACIELKEYLVLLLPADNAIKAANCEASGITAGTLPALDARMDRSTQIWNGLKEPNLEPHVVNDQGQGGAGGTPRVEIMTADQQNLLSQNYLTDVTARARQAINVADLPAATADKANDELNKLRTRYGQNAVYLDRALGELVNLDPQAVKSFAIALALDSLILVLAFLSELPNVKVEASGPKPLNEGERRKLGALIKMAQATDEPSFRAERLLVEHLKPNQKTSNFEIDLTRVGLPDERNLLRGLLNSQVGGEASLAWAIGKERFAVTPRGYFELLRAMDDALRQRHETRESDYGDVPAHRQPVADPAERRSLRPGRGGAGGYDYSKLFVDKDSPPEDGPSDVPDYLKTQEATRRPANGAGPKTEAPGGIRPFPGARPDPKDRGRR